MISPSIRRRIRRLHAEGMTVRDIGTTLGVSHNGAWRIANGIKQGKKARYPKDIPDEPNEPTFLRFCLKCDKEFTAQGKYNRVCPRCKDTDEWQANIRLPVLRE